MIAVDSEPKFRVASENGLGKRTAFEEYLTKGRGGKGMKTMNVTEKTGKVIGALAVEVKNSVRREWHGVRRVYDRRCGAGSPPFRPVVSSSVGNF